MLRAGALVDRALRFSNNYAAGGQRLPQDVEHALVVKSAPMAEAANPETFEEIVDWACRTLPQKIRDLPDFPGIQVVDEPPADVFQDISHRRKWRRGTELLGLYSGVHRTERRHNLVRVAPDLIFVFRGPILRCSKGDLRAEVKQVVWHEVAHWLGHDEEEVKELGLSRGAEEVAPHPLEGEARKSPLEQHLRDDLDEAAEAKDEEPRCIKCYSADVTCHEGEKPLSYAGANWFDPITVHVRNCTCNSCGYEWDNEDTA
ncbi:MAG: metallopeptidase family protein [Terriglobales bacterium]